MKRIISTKYGDLRLHIHLERGSALSVDADTLTGLDSKGREMEHSPLTINGKPINVRVQVYTDFSGNRPGGWQGHIWRPDLSFNEAASESAIRKVFEMLDSSLRELLKDGHLIYGTGGVMEEHSANALEQAEQKFKDAEMRLLDATEEVESLRAAHKRNVEVAATWSLDHPRS